MSLFADLEAMVSGAVDDVFGEAVSIVPRAAGEYVAGGADPDREPFTVTAIVDFKPVVTTTRRGSRDGGDMPELAADQIHVSIAAPGLPFVPRQGDVVVATSRTPVVAFAIAVAEPDELGRILLRCKPTVVPS